VLTTRTEPPLPLASLRARNQLLEIDAASLRFDLQETRAFLEHEKATALGPADLMVLHSRTEGWPAAMRILVSTSASAPNLTQNLRNLSASHRPIDAYLTEMLDGLPADLVSFMMRTAVLSRLSVPLCEAVTGATSASALLATIERRQLLLTALDQEGQWFRYHPVLAEYLKRRLEAELRDELPDLNRRAAHWYASQETWTEAVQHAIASGDTDQAVAWIERCAMDLVKRGDLLTLLAWQRLFPSEIMKGQPAVRLAIAWGHALAIRTNEAMQMVADLERDLGASTSVDREQLTNECRLIRSVALTLGDEGQQALPLAEQCLSKTSDPWLANVATNVVSFWRLKNGDLDGFYATPWIPYPSDADSRTVFERVYRRCTQGIAEAQQLRFQTADRYFREALRLAQQHVGPNSIAAALPASLIARIAYEEGRVEEAEAMVIDRLQFINAGANIECALSAYFVMVRAAASRMNFDHARALLEQAESLAIARNWPRLHAAIALHRVWLHLKEGRTREAVIAHEQIDRLAKKHDAAVGFAWSEIDRYSGLARALVASEQERLVDAIRALERVGSDAERVHDHYFALHAATHLSIVRFRAGQTMEALREFRHVLDASSKAGIHQIILDEGVKIGDLLAAFQAHVDRTKTWRDLKPYFDGLMTAWARRHENGAEVGLKSKLKNPLSAREGAILNLIAEGLSNKEIARNLTIAPETVKSHVKNLFAKLNAEKRAQAVARAQSLGLVSARVTISRGAFS
jgi:LuxR family maltose regulon positive regulatory protein